MLEVLEQLGDWRWLLGLCFCEVMVWSWVQANLNGDGYIWKCAGMNGICTSFGIHCIWDVCIRSFNLRWEYVMSNRAHLVVRELLP
jgi:hypothetical protein